MSSRGGTSETEKELLTLAKHNTRALRSLKAELISTRKERGLSQQQVADLLGLTQSAVSQFEAGENDPRLSTIRTYALAVGAKLDVKVERPEKTKHITQNYSYSGNTSPWGESSPKFSTIAGTK